MSMRKSDDQAGIPCRLLLSEPHLRFRIGYYEGLLRNALRNMLMSSAESLNGT